MKFNSIYKLFALIMSVIYIFTLTGCDKTSEEVTEPTMLVIIAGLHSNASKIDIPISEKIEEVYSDFGNVNVIIADGSPTVVHNEQGNTLGYYNNTYITNSKREKNKSEKYWRKNILLKQTEYVNSKIAELAPDDPQVDTLAAFHEASKAFNKMSSGNNEKKEIIIFDSGLCTSGALNFLHKDCLELLKNETKIDKDSVKGLVDSLEAHAEIPDLSGISVTWYGLGSVAEPQKNLGNLAIANLQVIWGEILQRANANPSDTTGKDSEYGYFVPTTSSEKMEYPQHVAVVVDWKDEEITLLENEIGFIPNSAEFYSEDKAIEVLNPIADSIKNYPDMKILLVGTTADPERNGGDISLSEKRANKVKECFISLGLRDEQIKTLGYGAQSPYYENEWINGIFEEKIAETNRSVIIMSYDSDRAQALVNNAP